MLKFFRHNVRIAASMLRNWNFEGSKDSTNWTVLRAHVNDTAIHQNYWEHSWKLETVAQSYRYFRIISTGKYPVSVLSSTKREEIQSTTDTCVWVDSNSTEYCLLIHLCLAKVVTRNLCSW